MGGCLPPPSSQPSASAAPSIHEPSVEVSSPSPPAAAPGGGGGVGGGVAPVVSGAVAQLLPVWLRPGAQAAWQKSQRWRLAALARFRAAVLFVGVLLAATGIVKSLL